jgi:hypothetical protein
LVCRIDLPDARLTPAMKTLPVSILNREKRSGSVTLRATLNKDVIEQKVKLTGEPVQQVPVALKSLKPGKLELSVALLDNGGKELFAEARTGSVPPPLAVSPPSPTHWCVEDGAPTVEGWVDVAVSDQQRAGATLDLRIEDASGKSLASVSTAPVPDGTVRPTIKSRPLPVGEYKLVAELRPRSGKPIRVEHPWHVIPRRLAEVTINSAGYPQYDGKPIFPLGIFNGGKFKEQGDAGFTVTHAYNAARIEPNWPAADANALKWLEQSDDNGGMKMLLMIPIKEAIHGDFDAVRRRVRMFRNHPGLLAWDEEEGFARGDFKADTLKKIRQIVAEEDPHHPFMVGDAKGVIGRMPKDRADFFPVQQMDLGMWWWYPLPFKERGAGEALEGDEGVVGSKELAPPAFLVNARIDKPLWVGVQSYKKKDARYPNPTEYRAQAYIAIIHGAKGLMWYGGSVTGGLFLAPEEGHWDDLKKLARELRDLSPVFMSATVEGPQVSPAKAPISVCLKDAGGRLVLLAANRGAEAAEVTFSSPRLTAGAAHVLSENREVSISAGKLRDNFAPYAVHVYEFKEGG